MLNRRMFMTTAASIPFIGVPIAARQVEKEGYHRYLAIFSDAKLFDRMAYHPLYKAWRESSTVTYKANGKVEVLFSRKVSVFTDDFPSIPAGITYSSEYVKNLTTDKVLKNRYA